jgi:4'-phosphopantetheinyl transferase
MDKMRTSLMDSGTMLETCANLWRGSWSVWDLPHAAPGLGKGQIHLWLIDRGKLSVQDPSLVVPFSRLECKRADGFRFSRDRDRYLIGRKCLRTLLAAYLQIQPDEVALTLGVDGKPQLEPPNPSDLEFNLTHAGRFTLIAVTRGAAIGVDLEAVKPQPDPTELARNILSRREMAAFDRLPEETKLEGFYRLWTMKEAVLKALGTGFRHDPRRLEIGITPPPVAIRQIGFVGAPQEFWTFIRLPVSEGFMAALAVQGAGWSVEFLRMDTAHHPC